MTQASVQSLHNTPNGTLSPYSDEAHDKVMKALPRPLADWLRYEATEDTCPVSIFREWRAGISGAGMSVDELLNSLRSIRREGARRTYGFRHPNAALRRH